MDQETFEDEINRLYEVGREDVLTDPKRRAAFTTSCIAASQAAVRQPGCEVRVTCRDAPEALFALTVIEEGCRRLKVLAKNQPTSSVIELINGSCIVVGVSRPAPRVEKVRP